MTCVALGTLIPSSARFTVAEDAQPSGEPPSITITGVPPWGSNENLKGQVHNVSPSVHRVAVYIFVEGWWTKPTFDQPTVSISSDGSWTADITTGGHDETATKIAAFLLPTTVAPPLVDGQQSLPSDLESSAIASIAVERENLSEKKSYRRFLEFSGYRWSVKARDVPVGPGPNRFSDRAEDVWADRDGLHLTIKEREDRWYCTEVILQESFGYGNYAFHTLGQPEHLDPNVVFGMFTWDTEAPFPYRELDFEYARWEDAEDPTNAQFVVQPHGTPGNLLRYRVEPTEPDRGLTHVMRWAKGKVTFTTARGRHPPDQIPEDKIISAWTYAGKGVPVPGDENIRINLWLNEGKPPQSGASTEVVVTLFSYERYTP